MAKIAPKGKKVTGTKKKDKITWQSTKPWKKALTVSGLAGNDVINFKKSTFKNKINGGKGNDKIYGGKKVDTVHGNEGDDLLYGYNGNDILYGDAGNDKIYGGKGNDKLYGGAGNDILNGEAGNDIIYVGAGNDTINAGAGTNTIYMKKKEGTNTILSGGGNDTLVFADEKNFDKFTFANVGNDLKVTAGGTTALIKNFVTGKSSVKNIKAGNLSFGKIIKRGEGYTIEGTSGNDLFLLSDTDEHDIKTGAGNDIVYIEDGYYDEIYASKGNNYINMKESYAETIYLKDMAGNNTVVSDWYGYFNLDFTENETSSAQNGDEVVKTLQLAEGDGTYKYVLGKRSGNDLILTTVKNKTVTIKDFYVGSGGYFYVEDETGSVEIDHGSDNNIYSVAPGYIKLTGNDNISSAQNKYIYGRENIAYNVTINSASGNNMEIYGTGNKTVNITNGNSNSISMYSDWNSTTGVCTANITGSKNSIYASRTLENSSYSLTGNNNYLSLYMARSATINLNGTGNYASVSINNNQLGNTMNITTQGQNEVDLTNEYYGWYQAGNTVFNITTKGNDKFSVGGTQYENSIDFNCTGSNGTNKTIGIGVGNNLKITGALETGKVDLDLYYSTMKNVITHYSGDDFIYFEDLNPNKMKFRRYDEDYYNGSIKINGAAGQGGADLNSTAFLNKFRVRLSSDDEGVYHTLNEFEQYFDTSHETIAHNFTFGSANMGYMKNLTKDYFVHGTGSTANDTYSNFTFASGKHKIFDDGGTEDILTIGENLNNVRMYFNITSEGSILNSDLYFLKTSEFQNFMKGGNVSGYLDIQKGLGAGEIEKVQSGNYLLEYSSLTSEAANSLRADVISWMSGKSYADTDAVINGSNEADKAALFAIYDSHTNFANNDANGYWGMVSP